MSVTSSTPSEGFTVNAIVSLYSGGQGSERLSNLSEFTLLRGLGLIQVWPPQPSVAWFSAAALGAFSPRRTPSPLPGRNCWLLVGKIEELWVSGDCL